MEKLSVFGTAIGLAGLAMVLGKATITGNVTGPAETAISYFTAFGTLLAIAGLGMVAASYHYKV